MRAKIVASLLVVAAVVVGTPSVASAGDGDTASKKGDMHLVGVTRVVSGPDADGEVQVLLDNGATISVSSEHVDLLLNPTPPPSTNAIVFGDCGYSTVNIGYKSNGYPVRMTTGFHTYDASVEYAWNVFINGPRYSYNYHASGNLAFRNDWNGSHNSGSNYPSGGYTATVSPPGSWALLWWGAVCYSGGPSQTAYL